MTWDGTSEEFMSAITNVASQHAISHDWAIIADVLAAALNANEIRAQMARLEAMVGQATSGNESKRMRNEMDALEAEVKRLAEKLKGAP